MRIVFQKSFQKDFAKCSEKIQIQTEERVALFLRDRFHPLLNLHMLRGEYAECWSLNVNSDHRVIFMLAADTMYLIRIGTHSQLYR